MRRMAPPLIAFAALILLLEIGTAVGILNSTLIPPPHLVWRDIFISDNEFFEAFRETALATTAGYILSCVLGVSIAILLSLSRWLKDAILPFAVFFQTVPIIAVAPLLVIYFGFGIGTVMAATTLVSIFPVLANTLLGLQSVDPGEIELFRLYTNSSWKILWKLLLPRAYPSIYAGLQIAAGLSVIGAVAGEFVAGGGLGGLIDTARTQQRIDLVFAALLLLSLLGLAFIACLRLANGFINAWRPYGLHLKD